MQSDRKFETLPIAVYCGASQTGSTRNPHHVEGAQTLGKLLAQNHVPLIWGAGDRGLMGAVSKAHMDNNGVTIGTSTQHLVEEHEGRQDGVSLFIGADGMQPRKATFVEVARDHIILPGGIGTQDECFEILLEIRHRFLDKCNRGDMRLNHPDIPHLYITFPDLYQGFFDALHASIERGDIDSGMLNFIHPIDHIEHTLSIIASIRGVEVKDLGDPNFDLEKVKERVLKRMDMYDYGQRTKTGSAEDLWVRLKDQILPKELTQPEDVNRSLAIWGGGRDEALRQPENHERLNDIQFLVQYVKDHNLRLIHSAQAHGTKEYITRAAESMQADHVSFVTKALVEENNYHCEDESRLNIMETEQSIDAAIKSTTKIIVLIGGGLDSLEKLGEFQVEADTREGDMLVIAHNYDKSFDPYRESITALRDAGYISPRSHNTIIYTDSFHELKVVLDTAYEAIDLCAKNNWGRVFVKKHREDEKFDAATKIVDALTAFRQSRPHAARGRE